MLIGEAPGATEDEKGVPFAGQAGNVLDSLLPIAGLSRDLVYITNVVKCRPPSNRNPTQNELETCFPYPDYQITKVNPKVVVLLGKVAASVFFSEPIQQLRGVRSKVDGYSGVFTSTYHPAAALYNPKMLPMMESDWAFIGSLIDKDNSIDLPRTRFKKAEEVVSNMPGQFSFYLDTIPSYIDLLIVQLVEGRELTLRSINDLYQKLRCTDGNLQSIIAERLLSTIYLLRAYTQSKSEGVLSVLKKRGLFISNGKTKLAGKVRSIYG